MKSFKAFLLEETGGDNLSPRELIQRDCEPFLKESKGGKLWRGIKSLERDAEYIEVGFFKGTVRQDRWPKDSPTWFHNVLNAYFKKHIGVPLRSVSLFVGNNLNQAWGYGKPYCIFPKGKIKYAWSPEMADPTHTFIMSPDEAGRIPSNEPELKNKINEQFKEWTKSQYISADDFLTNEAGDEGSKHPVWKEFIKHFIETNDLWQYNDGMREFITNKKYKDNEMMIVCDDFYAIEYDYVEEYLK